MQPHKSIIRRVDETSSAPGKAHQSNLIQNSKLMPSISGVRQLEFYESAIMLRLGSRGN
jgi:hypothetical protein